MFLVKCKLLPYLYTRAPTIFPLILSISKKILTSSKNCQNPKIQNPHQIHHFLHICGWNPSQVKIKKGTYMKNCVMVTPRWIWSIPLRKFLMIWVCFLWYFTQLGCIFHSNFHILVQFLHGNKINIDDLFFSNLAKLM
jgi:hypothetical protein